LELGSQIASKKRHTKFENSAELFFTKSDAGKTAKRFQLQNISRNLIQADILSQQKYQLTTSDQ
jgi:hypothetical protein